MGGPARTFDVAAGGNREWIGPQIHDILQMR
jgi:hypothetical protein